MIRPLRSRTLAALALAAMAAPLLAARSDAVHTRVAGLREMGAAFKSVMDGLRGGQVQTLIVQRAAAKIKDASQAQYHWFPAGSGPQRGVKTAAKPEIWTKPVEFRAAQDALARQADAFQQAANSGNADAIRAAFRNLGGACKGCHDQFRVPDHH